MDGGARGGEDGERGDLEMDGGWRMGADARAPLSWTIRAPLGSRCGWRGGLPAAWMPVSLEPRPPSVPRPRIASHPIHACMRAPILEADRDPCSPSPALSPHLSRVLSRPLALSPSASRHHAGRPCHLPPPALVQHPLEQDDGGEDAWRAARAAVRRQAGQGAGLRRLRSAAAGHPGAPAKAVRQDLQAPEDRLPRLRRLPLRPLRPRAVRQ